VKCNFRYTITNLVRTNLDENVQKCQTKLQNLNQTDINAASNIAKNQILRDNSRVTREQIQFYISRFLHLSGTT